MARLPTATYRLQLNPHFTFDDAIPVLKYLASLNISHIYTSPYLQAAKGSMHGYDVANYSQINVELGGILGHKKFCKALKKNKLEHIVDVVPNHMAAMCPDNSLWTDVLQYGQLSPYSKYFDLDWSLYNEKLSNKILLPFLAIHYDEALLAKKIQLRYEQNNFIVSYESQIFPVSPHSLSSLLFKIYSITKLQPLENLAVELNKKLDNYSEIKIIQQKIYAELKNNKEVANSIFNIIDEINNSYDKLNAFLEEQNYFLVYWRVSTFLISYRRFFHLNSLVGLRVENEEVFLDSHEIIKQWLNDGLIDGLRIDHIDGLYNPTQYLKRLSRLISHKRLLVEKILLPHETLPYDWSIDGTTGYDFLNNVLGLFIKTDNEKFFTDFYVNFIGGKVSYYDVLREKKLLVLQTILGADINYLLALFGEICRENNYCHIFTNEEVRRALTEIIACLPIYRTYIQAENGIISDRDQKIICDVIQSAQKNQPQLDMSIFIYLQKILLLKIKSDNVIKFVMRFQQLTGPAMAKGEEDTAFYCYNRFIALNEVGADPAIFGITPEVFHDNMRDIALHYPHTMLATSTHDTKRSEDIRARLAVLSEMPVEWFNVVQKWVIYNEKRYVDLVPDRNTQYFLYQNLVGAWPIAADRVLSFMEKSAREAKTYTSWIYPDPFYEQKLAKFVTAILTDKEFCAMLDSFVKLLIYFGRINSLAQTAIKLTAPGIPDFYQGTEVWNFNFVDPDNRREVDFKSNIKLFQEMQQLSLAEVMQRIDEGLPKLWLIQKTLELRNQYAQLFYDADYVPIYLKGKRKEHGICFLRANKVLTFVPRFLVALNNQWEDTYLDLPQGVWRNILTGDLLHGGYVSIQNLIAKFPVAILTFLK